MTTDVDHEGAIRRQMLENFDPVEPADVGSQSNEIVEQVIISNSSAEGFGHVVLKQWRRDSRASPPREVWAVLGSKLEVHLLALDLAEGCVSDAATEPVPPQTFASLSNYTPGHGQILIITYDELAYYIRVLGDVFPPHVTVMMNFGFGRITFDMAFASTLLMCKVKCFVAENKGRIAACTVANSQAPFFGPSWPPRRIQELDTCQDKDGRQVLEPVATDYVWYGDVDKHDAPTPQTLLDTEARLRDPDGTKRAAIIVDKQYRPSNVLPGEAFFFNTQSTDGEATYEAKKEPGGSVRQLFMGSDVTYCGPIGELGHIIVYPFVEDWVFDKEIGHVVWSPGTTSKAEVHHAARLRGKSGAAVGVHCLMSRRDYEQLPLLPPNSPAHTIDLPRLLLVYVDTWGQGVMPFSELPVSLPADEYVVEEQLRRLWLKGLITCTSGPARPHGAVGRRLLHSVLVLTDLGLETSKLVKLGRVRGFHVACLLGQLMCPHLARADSTPGVVANIAAILGIEENGWANTNAIVQTPKGQRGDFPDLAEFWAGPAADQLGRGPIWSAMAIWHKLRASYDLRLPKNNYVLDAGKHQRILDLIDPADSIRIDLHGSYKWDQAQDGIEAIFGAEVPKFGDDARLTREELVEIDKRLVLAFLDKLAFIPATAPGDGPFAYDLVSHRELQAPPLSQLWQLDPDVCRELEARQGGQPAAGIFCIYTWLLCKVDSAGKRTWEPYDLTHVFSEAVYKVLEEVREDEPVENLLRKIRADPPPEL